MPYHDNDFQIKNFLINHIDGFKDYCTCDIEDDIYLFFGNLGGYLQCVIDKKQFTIVDQIYDYINALLEGEKNAEFENMLAVQVFEMQCDKLVYYNIARSKLSNAGKELLSSVSGNFQGIEL